MRFHPKALMVATAFWGALLIAGDVTWGLVAVAMAAVIDFSVFVLPFSRAARDR
jgi:hypothetical protein